jgi:Fic family protein
MTTKLQSAISQLASSFATEVLNAIRGASLEEILGAQGSAPRGAAAAPARRGRPAKTVAAPAKKARGGRLPRRSPEQLSSAIEQIVGLLKKNKEGLRSEQIQAQLGLAKNEVTRPLVKGLEDGVLKKKGQKRSTTYFAR